MFHYLVSFVCLFLVQGKTHVLAGMVILQDAYAHPLISGNFPEFRDVNIIQIIHAHRLLVCLVIRGIYHFNGHSCIPQLLDGLSTDALQIAQCVIGIYVLDI